MHGGAEGAASGEGTGTGEERDARRKKVGREGTGEKEEGEEREKREEKGTGPRSARSLATALKHHRHHMPEASDVKHAMDRTVMRHRHHMPEASLLSRVVQEKIREMEDAIKAHLGKKPGEALTEEDMTAALLSGLGWKK